MISHMYAVSTLYQTIQGTWNSDSFDRPIPQLIIASVKPPCGEHRVTFPQRKVVKIRYTILIELKLGLLCHTCGLSGGG